MTNDRPAGRSVARNKGGLIARVRPFGKGKPLYKNGGRHHVTALSAKPILRMLIVSKAPGSPTPGHDDYGRELQFRLLQGDPPAVDGRACDSRHLVSGVRAAWQRPLGLKPLTYCQRVNGTPTGWCGLKERCVVVMAAVWAAGWGIRPRTPSNIAPPFGAMFGDPGAGTRYGIGENYAHNTSPGTCASVRAAHIVTLSTVPPWARIRSEG